MQLLLCYIVCLRIVERSGASGGAGRRVSMILVRSSSTGRALCPSLDLAWDRVEMRGNERRESHPGSRLEVAVVGK